MKHLDSLSWNPASCRQELTEFRDLLGSQDKLTERKDILPFFRQRLHLSAFLGSSDPDITRYDRLKHEYPLFGDFLCDLVVGDSVTRHFVLVEFEDAAPNSVFSAKKATPEWATRYEHGQSQLVDWFWKMHDMEKTQDFRDRFGDRPRYSGLLVVGRTQNLEDRERRRLEWREEYCPVNSRRILCRTFDQPADDLERRLAVYPQVVTVTGGFSVKPVPLPGSDEGPTPPE